MKRRCPNFQRQQQTCITGHQWTNRVRWQHGGVSMDLCMTNRSESRTTKKTGVRYNPRKKKRRSAKLKNTGFMLGICREYGNVSLATILQRDNSVTSTFILIVDRSVKCGHFMGTELSYAFVNATIRSLLLFFSILKFFWRAFLLGPFELKGLSAVFTKFLFCNASARLINVSSGKCFKMTTLTCRSNLTCVSTKMNMTMLGLKPD